MDNTDIVSALYNIIKGSKTLKEKDHANFKVGHEEFTKMRLNESSKESRQEVEEEEKDVFTAGELMYLRMYYKSDYELITKLNVQF